MKFRLVIIFITLCAVILFIVVFGTNLPINNKNKAAYLLSPSVSLHTTTEVGVSKQITGQENKNCNTDNDCKKDESCRVMGPLIAHQPVKKVCVSGNQVNPL